MGGWEVRLSLWTGTKLFCPGLPGENVHHASEIKVNTAFFFQCQKKYVLKQHLQMGFIINCS